MNCPKSTEFFSVCLLGGAGFVGSRICHFLLLNGCRVKIFEHAKASLARIQPYRDRVEVTLGDYSQEDMVLQAIADCDVVINLIHTTVPFTSMEDPAYDIISNVVASVGWMKRLQEAPQVRKVIYVSSGGTVYGKITTESNIKEEHATNPICSYGITKLAIEKYTSLYCSLANVQVRIVRPANIYGASARIDRQQGLIATTVAQALCGQTLNIMGTGEVIRDYIYVDDIAEGVVSLLNYEGKHEIFNIGSGEGHSINQVVAQVKEFLPDLQTQYVHSRDFDVLRNVLDISRITNEVSWRPRIGLAEGIKRVVDELKKSMEK